MPKHDPENDQRDGLNRLVSDLEQTQGAMADIRTEQALLRQEAQRLLNMAASLSHPVPEPAPSRRAAILLRAEFLLALTRTALLAGRTDSALSHGQELLGECGKIVTLLRAGETEPPPAFGLIE